MLPILMGDAVPQTPWDLPLWGLPDGGWKREAVLAYSLPIRIATCNGARVTSQCCPILHTGTKYAINRSFVWQDVMLEFK